MQASLHPGCLERDFASTDRAFALDRLAAVARSACSKFFAALRPIDFDEAYLSQAQNHADLERRMRDLQYSRGHSSIWY